MSIPAGHIITVGGLNVIDRLQDAGLQNPKVPTEVVRETGNDLVVAKILTEADFTFQMTSWDVSCDMMALLTGKVGDIVQNHGPAHEDAAGTTYKWENCKEINLACPWARDTGSEGGDISSGVIVPSYYPTALSYKFGVTSNAEQQVTLSGGSYYMAEAYPIEEVALGTGEALTVETKEKARPYRIGGFGGTLFRHVFGVLVDGVIQQEGVDYVEEGGAKPAEEGKKVKIKFITLPALNAQIKFIYFSDEAHALPQAVHATTITAPAAVRGRNIEVFLGTGGGKALLRGVQSVDLAASTTGSVQREMGTQDPIGYNITGTDVNGTVTLGPKDEEALYVAIESMTGILREEVYGYINEHAIPLTIAIFDPKAPATVLKSIHIADALFQLPGTNAKVNTTTELPISWESENGSFSEIKGEIPA